MSDVRRRETTYSDPDDVRGPLWEEAVAASAGHGALVPAGDGDDASADDEPLAPGNVSGNLRRYARWQWRDFWRNRGGWLALGMLLGVWLLVYLAGHRGWVRQGDSFVRGPMRPEGVIPMAHAFAAFGGGLAALLGVGGLVSRERERGLQRFLFAKPVRAVRYYLQAFGINSAGALLVLFGTVLAGAAFLGAMMPVGTVFAVGVGAYVLTAGLTFLASTLVRFDAPIAAAWLLIGFPVVGAAESGIAGARALSWLFPQGPALAVAKAVGAGRSAATPEQVILAGALIILIAVIYGLLALAGGVAVLRRRTIST